MSIWISFVLVFVIVRAVVFLGRLAFIESNANRSYEIGDTCNIGDEHADSQSSNAACINGSIQFNSQIRAGENFLWKVAANADLGLVRGFTSGHLFLSCDGELALSTYGACNSVAFKI